MPNRLTRVPDSPAPTLPRWAAAAVIPADAFMGAMFSRPGGLSLRSTWVTPATFWMSLVSAFGAVVLTVFAAISIGNGWLPVIGVVFGVLLFIGAGAVTLVGMAQKRAAQS